LLQTGSVILIGLGIGLRLWWALSIAPEQVSDARWYSYAALTLAAGEGYHDAGLPTAYYPVGYPATLASFYWLFGTDEVVARVANAVFAGGTLLGLFAIARALTASRLAATLTLLAFAIYPADIAYTSITLSQMLFNTYALTGSALCLSRVWPKKRWLLLGGALLGCATLTRHQGLALLPLIIVARLLQRHRLRRWAQALFVAVAFLVTLAPWTIRNAVALGGFVPVSTNGGINLYIGNNPSARGRYRYTPQMEAQLTASITGPRRGGHNEVVVDRLAAHLAWLYVAQYPKAALELWPSKFNYLYGDDDAAFGYWIHRLSDETQVSYVQRAKQLDLTYYPLLLWLGGLGASVAAWELCSRRKRLSSLLWLPALVVMVFTALHLLTFGDPCYHHPMMPWIAIYAGYGVAAAWRYRDSARRVFRLFVANRAVALRPDSP
jgi:4-amino-4-deoxy-L-arabinose transferase-like glycosyltransferase